MRLVRRGANGEVISLAPVITVIALLLLAVLGAGGAVIASKVRSPSGTTAEAAAKKNYAVLPAMTFSLGGGDARLVDVKVLLEVDPTVSGKVADPYVPRIADQLSDKMRSIDPSQLAGADGAKLMKSTIASVLDREMRNVRVREILLDRMVVR